MNPTLSLFFDELHFRFATRERAIRGMVLADITAGQPRNGEMTAGQKTLAALCNGTTSNQPYYVGATLTAATLGAAATAGATWLATRSPATLWTATGAAALAALALVAFYQMVARRHGPRLINEVRLEEARTALACSGDPQATVSLPILVVLLALALLDGALAGTTIAAVALGTLLTPTQAILCGAGFSLVLSALVYHLAQAAAREGEINRRRNQVRALLTAGRQADLERAAAMKKAVGHQLDGDYTRRANRYATRAVLIVLILALSAATFTVRVRAELASADVEVQGTSMP